MKSTEFGGNLFILHKNQHKYLNDRLKEYDLNIIQALFIIKIHNTANINQNDLAQYFFLTKGSVAKSLKKLEEKSFLKRQKNKEDNRNYNLILTDKSINLIPIFKKLTDEWAQKVGLNELNEEFFKNFQKLTINSMKINQEVLN